MIHYYLAKYISDVSRNEPTNIGVIVHDGQQVLARFDGEDDEGHMDLRRVRHRVTSSKAYRAWTNYWRATLEDPVRVGVAVGANDGPQAALSYLLEMGGREFYIESGGTILIDRDQRELEPTLQDLFGRLVRSPDPPSPPSLQEKSRQALSAAGAPLGDETRFQERVSVEIDLQGVRLQDEVSYAVMNGEWHYLQEMPFDPGAPRRSRKEATHCAFLFEHAARVRESGIILYDGSDIEIGQYRFLEMLMKLAPVVNVSDTERAAESLHEALGLSEHQ